MECFVFLFKFHWHLFPSIQVAIRGVGLDNGAKRGIVWTNSDLVYSRIYALLGPNELNRATKLNIAVDESCLFTFQKWYDQLLTWNASEFNNIHTISIPAEWVWTPDVTLVNT